MDLEVFVQHVPGRPCWDRMQTILEATDIGTNYVLHSHPSDLSRHDNLLCLLERMSEAETEFVLRLEDDCSDVNLHIKHNLLTWRAALGDHRFGVGWGLRLGGPSGHKDLWLSGPLHGSLCTFFRTETVRKMLPIVRADPHTIPEDIVITRAIQRLGKLVCIHGPSLVENDISVPSTIGSVGHNLRDHTSYGSFEKAWRR